MELFVPTTYQQLHVGDIVILTTSEDEWRVYFGEYTYQEELHKGYFLQNTHDGSILPATDEILAGCTIVIQDDTESDEDIQPAPDIVVPPRHNCKPECPPCPPKPIPQPITPPKPLVVDNTFITVQTITDRDKLNIGIIPHGKLVRVNNVNGKACYYLWNRFLRKWQETSLVDVEDVIKVAEDELIIDITEGVVSSELTIDRITEGGVAYIRLLGKDGAEVDRTEMPPITGHVGETDNSKLVTYVSAADDTLSGQTLDVVTDLTDPTNSEVPTAATVNEAIQKIAPMWTMIE